MNRKGHEILGVGCWVVGVIAFDAATWHYGYGIPVGPVAYLVGIYPAKSFAAGNNSPDMDRIWAPDLPKRGYHWSGHRGWTHRFWFASVVALLCTLVFWLLCHIMPLSYATAAYSPAVGWWSHLLGDMLKGRLKVGPWKVGLGHPFS